MSLKRAQQIAVRHRDAASGYKARRGFQEHERRLFIVYAPEGFSGADAGAEPLPMIKEVVPVPRIVNKPLDTAATREAGGFEIVRLQRFECTEVTRELADEALRPDLYFVVLAGDAPDPTPEDFQQVNPRLVPRFRLIGTPEPYQDAWKLTLVEER
jgi:hypothetical protein